MRCGLCDMGKATKYRIPACKRPATHWVKDGRRGGRFVLCEYHWRRTRTEGDAVSKKRPPQLIVVVPPAARYRVKRGHESVIIDCLAAHAVCVTMPLPGKWPKPAKGTVVVRCEDCATEWTAHARAPMRKCLVCGGAVVKR